MHVFMTTFLLLRNSYTECQSPYVEFGLELGGGYSITQGQWDRSPPAGSRGRAPVGSLSGGQSPPEAEDVL